MQWGRRALLVAVFAAATQLAIHSPSAWSQTGRTIRLILPFPPGGPADAMARIVAEQIGASGGPNMVVESHPGAATEIGTEYVFHSAPDGDTLAVISNSFIVLPNVRKLNYDPLSDFAPVCQLASFPPLIVVNGLSPYRTLADLINAAHDKPGTITLGTIGPGTSSQIAFEMIKRAAKANITFVPFAGYTPAVQAVLSNTVTAAIADYSTLQGQLQTGKLRALATTSPTRIAPLPDLPTVAELGYKEVVADFFGGVAAPAKTPNEKLMKLIGWFSAAIEDAAVKAKFAALGFIPGGPCGVAFGAVLRKDYDEYGHIVREANIKLE
jgi:tripartite-type tricarboxylate transporter receptor subunit TctC